MRCRPPQRRSGRAERRPCCRRAISSARPDCCIAWLISPSSSLRWSGVRLSSNRCAAAARRARESMSSSRFCGDSGKKSPYFCMNSSNCSWVCSPRASASSISLSAFIISRTRSRSCGVALCNASRMPANWASSTSSRSMSWICWNARRASSDRHGYSANCRTAREVSLGSVSSSASASRAESDGSGKSSRRSASSAWSSSSLTLSRVPSRRPLRRSSRARSRALRRSASNPLRPSVPRRSMRLSALRGEAPARTSSPISSSASRTSNGAASGSGPPCQAP